MAGQLALDGQVPLVVPARAVLGIDLEGRVGLRLVSAGKAGDAGDQRGRSRRSHAGDRHGGAVDAGAETGGRVDAGNAEALAGSGRPEAGQGLLEAEALKRVADLLDAVQAVEELSVAATDHHFVVGEFRGPGERDAWRDRVEDEIVGILA